MGGLYGYGTGYFEASVEVLYIAAKMTDFVSLVRNSRGNILHRVSRLDLQMARMTIKYR